MSGHDLTTVAHDLADASITGAAYLVVHSSPQPEAIGQVFRLGADDTIGRGAEAEIHLVDDGLSRRHARVRRQADGEYSLIDLGSRNGSLLNGVRVTSEVLREGDQIHIGRETILRFTRRHIVDGSGASLRKSLAASLVAVFELDLDTGEVEWSEHIDHMLELEVGTWSMRRTKLLDLVHSEDRGAVTASLEAGRDAETIDLEFQTSRPPGRWLHCRGSVSRDHMHNPVRLQGTAVDITERKQAEYQLHRFADTFARLFDGVVTIDPSGTVVDWNPRATEMFGWSRDAAVGRDVASLLVPGDPNFTNDLIRVVQVDQRWRNELAIRARAGEPVMCEVAATSLRDESDRPIGYVLVFRDLTDEKRLQQRLVLADRLASVGTLAAGVAHEINTPLQCIIGNLQVLEEEFVVPGPAASQRELTASMRAIADSAHRIARIVRDLGAYLASPEPGFRPTDLGAVVQRVRAMIDGAVRERAVLEVEIATTVRVRANEAQMIQILLNLVMNAVQAIPMGDPSAHRIRIEVREVSDEICVSMSDTGVGIAPEAVARIFDPFFTTKPVGQGTGTGLWVCHNLVKSMGGRIEVESAPDAGTRFAIFLPRASA
jgi:PAS domain S-box-containing protein